MLETPDRASRFRAARPTRQRRAVPPARRRAHDWVPALAIGGRGPAWLLRDVGGLPVSAGAD